MNLVIQSPGILTDDTVTALQARATLGAFQRIDDHAVRFALTDAPGATDLAAARAGTSPGAHASGSRPAVAAFCATAHLDYAYVHPRAFATFGLLVMDMDSTLITIECVDEIADFCGLKKEVAAITEAAMRGEITDFSESLRRRVALLKGLDASALDHVYTERLRLSPGAPALLSAARAAGVKTLLVSGGFTFFTERLKARLNLDYARANTLDIVDGKLTGKVNGPIIDAQAKADVLVDLARTLNIGTADTIAVGDGSNDLLMMAAAGLSVAYHAKPVVRDAAQVAFNHVGLDGLPRLFA